MTFEDFFNEYLALHTGGPYAVYEVSKLQEMQQKFAYVFEAGRKAGLEEAIDTIMECDNENWYRTQSEMAGAFLAAIRAKMEEKP